jgi:hypothetical protein
MKCNGSDYEFEKEGNSLLAVAVLKQAAIDYRKLKVSKKPVRKIEGSWMVRAVVMGEIEDFFKENGGASFYLELLGSDLDVGAILKQLKNE